MRRDSPEPHPLIVLSAWRTPESFTPSADLRRFPISFHCRYSVITIVASYHTFSPLSTASFLCKTGHFPLISSTIRIFCFPAAAFLSKQAIFHGRTNVFLYSLPLPWETSLQKIPEHVHSLRHFQRLFRTKGKGRRAEKQGKQALFSGKTLKMTDRVERPGSGLRGSHRRWETTQKYICPPVKEH